MRNAPRPACLVEFEIGVRQARQTILLCHRTEDGLEVEVSVRDVDGDNPVGLEAGQVQLRLPPVSTDAPEFRRS